MLPATRQPGRCIYCAFRARQYSLQTRRLPHRNREERERGSRKADHGRPSFIRYQETDKGHKVPKGSGFLGKVSDDGVVRKFYGGKINQQTPQEQARDFRDVLDRRLKVLQEELKETPLVEQLGKEREAQGLRPRSWNQTCSLLARGCGEVYRCCQLGKGFPTVVKRSVINQRYVVEHYLMLGNAYCLTILGTLRR